jgi:hypothetical protein
VRVVRRELEVPFRLAGIGVERGHAAGIEVVAGAHIAVHVGAGIAGALVDQVQCRIVGAGHPQQLREAVKGGDPEVARLAAEALQRLGVR